MAAMAAILVTGAIIGGFFAVEKQFSEEKPSAEEEVSSTVEEPEKIVLGVFEGRLALFAGESPYPNMVYDFFIRNLPLEDQERLNEGIEVSSENELESLLEDFMS